MIKLVKDKKSWWIDIDLFSRYRSGNMVSVTAEEIIDLNNQFMKMLINKRLCPKCLEPMFLTKGKLWQCKDHSDLGVSIG